VKTKSIGTDYKCVSTYLGAQAFGNILEEVMLIPSRLPPPSLDSDPCFIEVGEDKETRSICYK